MNSRTSAMQNVRRKAMKISSSEKTTFDKLSFPRVVYKYRRADNAIHRTILTDQAVYFAPPKSFEDKFDCKIPIRYDLLTDDEIFDNYLQTLREINPQWDPLYLRDQAIIWRNMGLMRDKGRLELMDVHYYNELNERYGVLSLTAEPANIKMWKKYSNNFNGFCIGFDPKVMFKFLGGGGAVEYCKKLPIIMPSDSIDLRVVTLTFSKLNKWKFEKEYRTQMFWPHPIKDDERKIVIPNTAFIEVILGHNINSVTQKEIIKQAQIINPAIEIKITNLVKKRVRIKPYA